MKKSESLQVLRGLAFLGIFFIHSGFVINWAGLGVSIFFVLSGFLTTKKHGDSFKDTTIKQNIEFVWGRIRGLYPLHIILMLMWAAVLLLYDNSARSFVTVAVKIFLNVTLTQSWIPYSTVNVCLNGVAWFLSSIAVHYFFFRPTSIFIRKKNNKWLITVLILAIAVQVLSCWIIKEFIDIPIETYTWFMYTSPLFRFADFYAGMCLAGLVSEKPFNENLTFKGSVIEIAATLVTILLYWSIKQEKSGYLIAALYNGTSLYIIPAMMWIWIFYRNNGIITHILKRRIFIVLGNLSSFLFLIHFPITNFDDWLLALTDNTFVITGVEFVISILLSVIYIKLEPWIMNRIKLNPRNKGTKQNEV